MVNGIHVLLYTAEPGKTRAFLKDVLSLPSVDVGRGWLIFAAPPTEIAAHPSEGADDDGRHELYLMCDEIESTMTELRAKGVQFSKPVSDQGWGLVTALRLPGCGREMGLYQPKHALPPRTT